MPDASVRLKGRSIHGVIYDFGEVLSYPPPPASIDAIAELLHVTPEKLREYYYAERQDYDRGNLTAGQYWRAVARDADIQLTAEQIEWLRRTDVEMWSNVNPQMLAWAAELRNQGMRTAVLSNMHADMAKSVRAKFAWLRDFGCVVLSAEIGFAKPDPEIFQNCLDCLKISANQALFIDDKARNTRAAEELGMAAICADSPQSIRAQLQETGWSGPLPR
jgi:putative hydrolase of the HAD superfamily